MNKQIYRILMVCTFAVALVATGCKKQTPVVDNDNSRSPILSNPLAHLIYYGVF